MLNLPILHQKLSATSRFLMAIGLYLLALVLHFLTIPITAGLAYVTFFPAVTLSFYLCGLRPGILATILSAITGLFIFTPPVWSFPSNFYEYTGFIYFLFSAYLSGFVITRLQDYELKTARELGASKIDLEHSKNILKLAKQASRAGTWYWNIKTNQFIWDDEMFSLFGLEKTEPSLELWENVLHPHDKHHAVAAVQNSINHKTPFIYSYRVMLPDNQIRWIDAFGSTYFDSKGNPEEMVGICLDASTIHESEELIKENEKRFRYLFEHLPVPYQSIDESGRLIDANPKMAELLGFVSPNQMIGMNFCDFLDKDYSEMNTEKCDEFKRTHHLDGELQLINAKGKKIIVLVTSHAENNVNGHYVKTHLVMSNITERRGWENALIKLNNELESKVLERTAELEKANTILKEIAREDALTKIPNRLALNERLHTEFVRLKRKKHPYVILMLDIDHFKRVNDEYGHAVGDEVLIKIASSLKSSIRAVDFACRFGGEEFLVLLPDTSSEAGYQVAEKIRKTIEASQHPAVAGKVTISIGLAIADASDQDEYVAIKNADDALYQAKYSGRNQTSTYSKLVAIN